MYDAHIKEFGEVILSGECLSCYNLAGEFEIWWSWIHSFQRRLE